MLAGATAIWIIKEEITYNVLEPRPPVQSLGVQEVALEKLVLRVHSANPEAELQTIRPAPPGDVLL